MSSVAINSLQSGAEARTASAIASNKTAMDKDAFLKLLVAQISNQDPLKPMEGTEFVTQLSQFSMVEQAIAQSRHLEGLQATMQGVQNSGAIDLVGKTVTVSGSNLTFDGSFATSTSANLAGPAKAVTATIHDESGNPVRTIELGAKPAGSMAVTWDGRDDAGTMAPAGRYQLSLSAAAEDGSRVSITTGATSVVEKVSYARGVPELVLRSGSTVRVSDVESVSGSSSATSSSATPSTSTTGR